MLAEAINTVVELGRKSQASIVKADAEPPHVYYLRKPDGTTEKQIATPTPRANKARDLASLVTMATAGGSEIWYSRDGVTLYPDRESRRDRVTMELGYSEQIAKLGEMNRLKSPFSQSALIKELRITFRDSLARAGELVNLLRKVNFQTNDEGHSEVGHGKVSLGKSLNASITGTSILPEYVTLEVPVFAPAAFRAVTATVDCVLEPDPMTRTFLFVPLPGEIEKAIGKGEADLGKIIRDLLTVETMEIPVLYGSPS